MQPALCGYPSTVRRAQAGQNDGRGRPSLTYIGRALGPRTSPRTPRLPSVIGSLLVLLLAVPMATWWIVGDQSEIADPFYADYLVEPPNISPTTEAIAGLIGLALVVGAFVVALLGCDTSGSGFLSWLSLSPRGDCSGLPGGY